MDFSKHNLSNFLKTRCRFKIALRLTEERRQGYEKQASISVGCDPVWCACCIDCLQQRVVLASKKCGNRRLYARVLQQRHDGWQSQQQPEQQWREIDAGSDFVGCRKLFEGLWK